MSARPGRIPQSQIGAFKILENAKKCADQNPGYRVFDASGKVVYAPTASDVPFLVKVSITDLNIRTGPGTDHAKTGKFTGIGVFTIVDVKSRQRLYGWLGQAEIRSRVDFFGVCGTDLIYIGGIVLRSSAALFFLL